MQCANKDTGQKCAEAENHRNKTATVPRAQEKEMDKDSGKDKGRRKKGHMTADRKFKFSACTNCGKIGHWRAVCRNTNTHEIEQDTEEQSPEVTVEAVWCMTVPNTAEEDRYTCGKFVESIVTDQLQDKFVRSLLMNEHEEYGECGKWVMNFLLRQAHDITVKNVNESGTVVNSPEHDAGQATVQEKSCDHLIVRHRNRHTRDAEVRVGTVGRICIANHQYHTGRSKWTRSWSNGRSSSQRFHWPDHSAVQSICGTTREKMLLEWNTTQNTWIHVHSNQ